MSTVLCPECDEKIRIPGKPVLGRRFQCHNCGVELELINTDPVELDWVYSEPDAQDSDSDWDWDDEDSDFDDEEDEEDDLFEDEDE
jgi:lysine biosynthesis protein LysW